VEVPARNDVAGDITALVPAERLARLRSIEDPVARAAEFRKLIKDRNTLTRDESALYRETVAEIRGDGEPHKWVARTIGITRAGVGRLLSPKASTR
jgi:hypothetical protein